MVNKKLCLLSLMLCLANNTVLSAEQTTPNPPLDKVEKEVETKEVETKEVETKEVETKSEADSDKKPTFDIFEFKVVGNSVLHQNMIEESVYDFMGEQKTIDDVEKARSALEKAYHEEGYLTVSINIPQQDVDEGIVQLQVVEGRVERLRVKDANYHSLGVIKARVSEFSEGKVPHFPTVQKQLATVNLTQNRQVAPILRPGKSPGKLEVDLKVQDKLPLHGSLELNDRFAPNTTETRLNGSLRYENLWQKDHSLGFSFQVSPEDTDEVKVISSTYVVPMLSGDYFAAYGVISRSQISVVGDITVLGDGNIFGARYIHPLPRLEHYYHTFTAGLDYKDFAETVSLSPGVGFETPITYTMFNMGYDGTYNAKNFQTKANVGLNFAMRAFGNSDEEFADRRFNAKANFAALRGEVKHLQSLPNNWKLQARLTGQVANGPLINVEQFTAGGVESVRGYTEANAIGDSGAVGSLELRTPSMHKFIQEYIKDLYAYTFVEGGYLKIQDALPNQIDSFDLLSTGLGVSVRSSRGFYAILDYAQVLQAAGDLKSGDDRLHFKLGVEW